MTSIMGLKNRILSPMGGISGVTYLAGLLVTFYLSTVIWADPVRVWARGFTWAVSKSTSSSRLSLYYLDQDESHLRGTLSYEYYGSGRASTAPAVIEGVLGEDGLFYPDVALSAKISPAAAWEPLPTPTIKGKRTRIKVKVDAVNSKLTVMLDAFKPLIGTYDSGRLVLKTGETSEFQLKYLVPPKDE